MLLQQLKSTVLRYRLRTLVLGALVVMAVVALSGAEAAPGAPAANRYIGVNACKNCHVKTEMGDQYHAWEKTKHAAAFKELATDKAKQLAKAAGVENPQTDRNCIACHETGYGLPAADFSKAFQRQLGVQCEACHGPGEKHMSARMKADDEAKPVAAGFDDAAETPVVKLPEGEILVPKDEATCVKCHNEKSPTFPGKFDFAEMMKKIPHPDPRLHPAKKK